MTEDLFKYKPDMNQKYNGIEKYIFRDAYLFFIKWKSIPNTVVWWVEDYRMANTSDELKPIKGET